MNESKYYDDYSDNYQIDDDVPIYHGNYKINKPGKIKWMSDYADSHRNINTPIINSTPYKLNINLGSDTIETAAELENLKERIIIYLKNFSFIEKPSVNVIAELYNNPYLCVIYFSNEPEALVMKDDIVSGIHGIIDMYKNKRQELNSIKSFDSFYNRYIVTSSTTKQTNQVKTESITQKKLRPYEGMSLKQRVNFQIKRSRVTKNSWSIRSIWKYLFCIVFIFNFKNYL